MAIEPGDFRTENAIPFAHPEALTNPERLFAAYFNSSAAGVGILNSEFRYLAINDKMAAMNGSPPASHVGKTLREILGDVADVLEPVFRRVLSTGEPVLNIEISAILPTRAEAGHWIADYFPIKDVNGIITRVCALVVEITEKKKLEQSVQSVSGKLRSEMDRLQMLLEVSGILASEFSLQQTFPRISARIRRVLRQEFASFALYEPATGFSGAQAIDFPLGKGFVPALPAIAGNGPAELTLREGSATIFTREQLQDSETEVARGFVAEGLQSLCCVPAMRPNGPVGILLLGSTRQDAFQPDDLRMLNQVAAQLALAVENSRAALHMKQLKQQLGEERQHLAGQTESLEGFDEFVGTSAALKQVLHQVRTVAKSDATVLVLGETGTGKEMIARAIHRLSKRSNGPFIKVNCASIPTGLLESELFGHEKGAFTGAISQKIGRMELADGGTLFLDEVGEIAAELQPKLLRVLQDHEFERLGSNRTIKINLRMVAATNRNLLESVAQHQFRSDLYYRLSVFPIIMPPLREHPEDIPLLVRHYALRFAEREQRHIERIPTETMKALLEWHWPGNVRELENLMERSVILSEGDALEVPVAELSGPSSGWPPSGGVTLDEAERQHIIRILRETAGVLSGAAGAANRLGLKRTTLQSKMERLNISRKDYSAHED